MEFSWLEPFAATKATNSLAVGIANLQLMVACYFAAWSGWCLSKRSSVKADKVALSLAAGIFQVALGFGLHRTFWFIAVVLAPEGSVYHPSLESVKWVTALITQLIIIGYGKHTRLVLQEHLGAKWWMVYYGAQVAAVALAIAL